MPINENPSLHQITRDLKRGACAVVVTAGGEGSRLGFNGPKGCFPITPIRHHTLFQRLAEKILYASRYYAHPIPLAIMTSPSNHTATLAHFVDNAYFGLHPSQVDFFQQPTLPFLNNAKEPIYQQDGTVLMAPDGNGSLFPALKASAILDKWVEQGVTYISLIPIDNPLAMPFDCGLMAMQRREESDIALIVIPRVDPLESVGVVKQENGRTFIVEYSELSSQDRASCVGDANVSLFSFSMNFAKHAATLELPIHYAKKCITQQGHNYMALKQERFIFDLLPHAHAVTLLRRDRKECFAPVKEAQGRASKEAAQQALMAHDRNVLMHLLEKEIPLGPIELCPCFYYPTPELTARLKTAKTPLNGYYGEFP